MNEYLSRSSSSIYIYPGKVVLRAGSFTGQS